MYTDLFDVITDRLADLGVANVGTALGGEQPLPSVQPYLAEDKEQQTGTTVFREIVFAVKVTVGHNDNELAAQAEMLGLLDTVRDGFHGWRPPDCVGIQRGFRVPAVRLEEFRSGGSTVYLVLLQVRVIPETFKRT
ncbi:MAG TPA: hypothetical protein ENI89_13285 [Desulfobulbus sp.]|nr:hypothetical protein [Desulfobulbus sp.]